MRLAGPWALGALASALMLAFAGCSSNAAAPPGADPDTPDPIPSDSADPDSMAPGSTEECAPGRLTRKAVWLSDVQFARAVTTLLGPDAVAPEALPDPALKPFSQKGIVVNTSTLRTRLDLAEAAAQSLQGRVAELTTCAADDDACALGFLEDFAHRAFRRQLADEELADLNAVYALGRETSLETGLSLAIEAIIASPSFSYRTEFGVPVADDPAGARQLGASELASLLSFWLTDGPPDDELLASAESGALDAPAELERQVSRLLSLPASRDSVTLTLMAAWGMSNLFGATKDPNLFPEYGPLLQSNMFEETRLFLDRALWSEGSTLDQVLTSRRSFVNQALADLYGVPFTGAAPTEFVEVDLPEGERAGLLTQPSLLSARARSDNTSVVARGLFVRSALLCLPRPPPPPEAIIAQVQELLAADLTERERADFRAMTSPCKNCHQSIDGFGLMLENYDAIGRYREQLEGQPIDPLVDLTTLGYPGTFEGAVDFAATAATDPQFSACLARHLAAYATGEDGLETSDCELASFSDEVPGQTSLSQIITTLARSPLLTTRSGD